MTTIGRYHGAKEMRGMNAPAQESKETAKIPFVGSRFGRMFRLKQAPSDQSQVKGNDREAAAAAPQHNEQEVKDFGSTMGGALGNIHNARIPAGFTFLGQFVGHDVTFDPTSSREQKTDLSAVRNYRTPALDLDSLYGSGPAVSPHLYDREQKGKFLLDEGKEFDLPRNSQGTALIADSRNDGNLILAQLHLAFVKFHNVVVDLDRIGKIPNDHYPDKEDPLERAQRLVQWHYQWIILREYLPLIVGPKTVVKILAESLEGLKCYKWEPENADSESEPFIPLEFSVAAYRFGHSQVRSGYRLNDNYEVGVLPLFSSKPSSAERQDLQGGPIKRKHVVNWKNFFETGVRETPGWQRSSKRLSTQLAGPLLHPPSTVFPNRPGESRDLAKKSLAVRDLQRGEDKKLPSGQEVARIMKEKGVDVRVTEKVTLSSDLGVNEKSRQDFEQETPLWYYILHEAEVQGYGQRLGDVGGRIVAEVFIGLLQADSTSLWGHIDLSHLGKILSEDDKLRILQKDQNTLKADTPPPIEDDRPLAEDLDRLGKKGGYWRPAIPSKGGSRFEQDFTIVDLLKVAGVETE